MKNYSLVLIILISGLAITCQPVDNTALEEPSTFHDGIEWRGENEIANYLSIAGIGYWMNIEREKAYTIFEEAVKLDSSLFACHTALAFLSRGEKSDYHTAMAKKYVVGENEVSNLFVSFLDIPRDSTGNDARRDTWAKMHELSNGPFIHMRYATSRDERPETLEELANLESFLDDLGMTTAHIYNIRGYMLNLEGDLEGGTEAIEKYLEMRPNGYNALDSRAEFYLLAGDTATAVEYYKKTVEQYPFAVSARNTLRDLQDDKD
jgi:tetratricopeptide (TPR) repeat protein